MVISAHLIPCRHQFGLEHWQSKRELVVVINRAPAPDGIDAAQVRKVPEEKCLRNRIDQLRRAGPQAVRLRRYKS